MSSSPRPHDWQTLADRFRLGHVQGEPVYVDRGAMGEIWRMQTKAGRWAVKWQFPWVQADPRPADVQVQLAAAAAGIPLPRPVLAPDGSAVIQVGDRHARVYDWVDLADPLPLPASAPVAAEAGRLLGLLHGLALQSDEPVDPWFTEVPELGYWPDLIDRAVRAEVHWAAALKSARPLIAELSGHAVAPSGRSPIVCHRDFNPDNILPEAATGRLIVLDWENSGPLDPVRELGYVVFTFCAGNGQFDQAAADALIATYATATGSQPAMGPDFFATAVAAELNVLRVMAEQALSEPEHRSHAEEFISDLLDQYLGDLELVTRLWSQASSSYPSGRD